MEEGLKNIFWASFISALAGLLGLLLEFFISMSARSLELRLPFVLNSVSLYVLLFGAFGVLLGCSVMVYERLSGRQKVGLDRKKFFFVSSFFAAILIIAGGWINYLLLPQALSMLSVVSNATFFVIVLIAFLVVHRLVQSSKVRFRTLLAISMAITVIFSLLIAGRLTMKQTAGVQAKPKRDAQGTKKPNVLIIVLDAVRPDHLSCYGYHRKTSPTIDKLASQGAVFSNAFAQSGQTFQSVPSILTSLYPSTHNMNSFYSALPSGSQSIFSIAKENGFTTSIFSGQATLTAQYGWDRENGVDVNSSPRIRQGLSILSYYFVNLHLAERLLAKVPFVRRKPTRREDDEGVVVKFINFLDEIKDQPFISYIHFLGAHAPYSPQGKYKGFFNEPSPDEIDVNDLDRGFYPFLAGSRVSDGQLKNIIARYDEEILSADQERLAKIIGHLEQKGLLENTLVIITADHGEEFYEHKQWVHSSTLFRTLIRVPLIVKWPDFSGRYESKSIDEIVELVDIVPTILGLWGVPQPPSLEGESLIPLMQGTEWTPKFAFSEIELKGKSCRSLVQDGYHVIEAKFGSKESLMLFDLRTDPDELKNIAGEKSALADEMLAKMKDIQRISQKKSVVTKKIKLDKDTEERLRSLGYIK